MAQPQVVDAGRSPEMATENLDAEFDATFGVEQPSDDETSAEDAPEATDDKAQPEAKPKPGKKNLDEDEDFRKYKSSRDKQLAEIEAKYKRQLREKEDALQQREFAQQQAALQGLQQGLANAVDDGERGQYIDQIAAIKSQTYVSQERAWAKYVSEKVKEEGLEADEFDPTRYRGQQGLIQFERDVAAAAKVRLTKELAEAKKAAAPDAIAEQIKKEVAKALRAQGLDSDVEAGSPAGKDGAKDSWERDLELFNQGKLPRGALAKKYGERG